MPYGNRRDLTGQKFNRLTVLKFVDIGKDKCKYWECICECGTIKLIKGSNLRFGTIQSCGCLLKERIRETKLKHGFACSNTENRQTYDSWNQMKQRCLNPKNPNFKNYGARGISICDRWINSFENFLTDMGKCSKGYSIERINNDGNYEPSNCKWILMRDQAKNRRNNHVIEFNGERKLLTEWAKKYRFHYSHAIHALKNGWSFEEFLKYREGREKNMENEVKPRLLTFPEAELYSGISRHTLKAYCCKSILPSVKIGKRRYLDRRVLDEWIDSHSTEKKVIQLRRR